ncbi:MAG: MerR family DNA-binding protein [Vicinamibacterales bacterium]
MIGGLAAAAGVGVETIRFYQRSRLLATPARGYGAARRYDDTHVDRVRFIKSAQRLGFTLDEVRGLLELADGQRCDDARRAAERKLADIRGRLSDLHRMEAVLVDLVAQCAGRRGRIACPIIASLKGTSTAGPEEADA